MKKSFQTKMSNGNRLQKRRDGYGHVIDSKKKTKETQKDMASSHRVATLLQTWIFFFLIYPDRKRTAAGTQLGLNFVWAAEKSSGRN